MFEKAKEAKNQTIQKSNEEIIQLAIYELQIYKNGNAKIQDLNLFDDENSECYKKNIKLKNKINEEDELATLIIDNYEYKINKDFQIIYEENNKTNIDINYSFTKLPIIENDYEVVITLEILSNEIPITKIIYPDGSIFENLNGENKILKENLTINFNTEYELECTLLNEEKENKKIKISEEVQLIPKMINNTTNDKSETVANITADSYYDTNYLPYFAFDKNISSAWTSMANAEYPHNLYYEFTDGKKRHINYVQFISDFMTTHNTYDVQVFGTNDNQNWIPVTPKTTIQHKPGVTYNIIKGITEESFNKFKFTCYGYVYIGLKDTALWEIQMYGD